MRVFAQILNDRVHWRFEAEEVPEFAPDIEVVEITGMVPSPIEGWLYVDGSFIPPQVADSGEVRARLLLQIDAAADAARLAVAGDPLRAAEYQVAEAEAKAWQAAGFAGDAPPSVRSWAEAKNWTGQAAAESIIAEAVAWNAALYALRDARLKAKEEVRNAADLDAAKAIAAQAVDSIRARVENLGNAAV